MPPCVAKTCAVCFVFAPVVNDLRSADLRIRSKGPWSKCYYYASSRAQSEASGRSSVLGSQPESQDSWHMLDQPRRSFPENNRESLTGASQSGTTIVRNCPRLSAFCNEIPREIQTGAYKRRLKPQIFIENRGEILPGKSGLFGADWGLFRADRDQCLRTSHPRGKSRNCPERALFGPIGAFRAKLPFPKPPFGFPWNWNSLYKRAQNATNVHNRRRLCTSCREWA